VKRITYIPVALTLAVAPALAERDRLYSKPEAGSNGGMRGEIINPRAPIEQILAIPPDEPRLVYKGEVTEPNRRGFLLRGLPMRKYDLVVIYRNRFFEGFKLMRGEDTLTRQDREKVGHTISRAEPYFTEKIIHRLEGETGRGNLCRCICTYLRDRPSTNGPDFRRTFKLVMLKDVGPGWQVVRARDLYPVWVKPDNARPRHHYSNAISGIRVTDYVKNLGTVDLVSGR